MRTVLIPLTGFGAEPADVRADELGEKPQNFAVVGMASSLGFAVDQPTVHADIEDTLVSGDKAEVFDDVLVVGEEIFGHAHGAI